MVILHFELDDKTLGDSGSIKKPKNSNWNAELLDYGIENKIVTSCLICHLKLSK